MIRIPTGDFVGIVADAIPFALPDADFADLYAVRLAWDGRHLHAQAHDTGHLGWSRWSPDENHVQDDGGPADGGDWGGADEPWSVVIDLPDAKHLVRTYKLGKKQYFVPLAVELAGRDLRVVREKDSGYSRIATVTRSRDVEFADFAAYFANHSTLAPVTALALNAAALAHFAKVRPRGPMEICTTGPGSPVLITIGGQFTGAIHPLSEPQRFGAGGGQKSG